jgi:dienelactone hydrolase
MNIVSVQPVLLDGLAVKISAPASGTDLPVVLLSHGYGSSLHGYGPLADHWAAQGFVVIQPTHLDSRTVGLAADDPRQAHLWRHRVEDMKRILDRLGELEAAVPGLPGRVDHGRVAAAGHSFGGQTAGVLLGLRVFDQDLSDERVTAGVLLATAGTGGSELFPWMDPSFAHMSTPALVVAGAKDDSPLSVRGPEWMTDAYHLSPGEKHLLTVADAEHSLGGIAGYEVRETTDENPARVALIQRVTTAYLRHALGVDQADWATLSDVALESKGVTG